MTKLSDNLVSAKEWYVDRLGYQVDFDSDWFVQLRSPTAGGVELGILLKGHSLVPAPYRQATAGVMLTVVVDDVESVYAKVRAAGDPIVEPPTNQFYGQRRLLVIDPDGMLVDVSSACDPDAGWLASLRR